MILDSAILQPLEPVEYSCPCSDRGEVYRVAPPYTTASDICDNNKVDLVHGSLYMSIECTLFRI